MTALSEIVFSKNMGKTENKPENMIKLFRDGGTNIHPEICSRINILDLKYTQGRLNLAKE